MPDLGVHLHMGKQHSLLCSESSVTKAECDASAPRSVVEWEDRGVRGGCQAVEGDALPRAGLRGFTVLLPHSQSSCCWLNYVPPKRYVQILTTGQGNVTLKMGLSADVIKLSKATLEWGGH